MNAILLAGGFGTRLRPLTDTIPKCLVPIKGKPLLQIWIENLYDSGVNKILINTHYLAEQVNTFISGLDKKYQLSIVHEPVLLGTAGTLRMNHDFFEDKDGMLIHADNYCLADFRAFIQAHNNKPAGCRMTMMTFETETPEQCGIVQTNEEGIVEAFYEKVKNPPGNLANGAIYILTNELIRDITFDTAIDFSTEVLPRLINKIYSYKTNDILADIGTPESYALYK